jgi:diketogulonate reductase-like aldo/keto reductase
VQAYSPLGVGNLLNHPTIVRVANRSNRTGAQILVRWGLEKGAGVVVKSSNPARIEENIRVFDFGLTKQDTDDIDEMECDPKRFCWDPTPIQ